MDLTKNQKELMWHTIGLSNGENRNFFGTSLGNSDSIEFEKLVKAGLAGKRKAPSWAGGEVVYFLTRAGIKSAKESFPKPKKLTKSQARYQRYLEYGDGFENFMDFVYWDSEK